MAFPKGIRLKAAKKPKKSAVKGRVPKGRGKKR